MSSGEKKPRSANMTAIEKALLADLCTKYGHVIENKKTDSGTVKAKDDAWKELAVEFRAMSTAGVLREWHQLKHVSFHTV
jgi:hypothetical protein